MARSSVKRLIHVSSFVVYDWARTHGTLDESSPLLKNPYHMGGYTIAKVWQERVVIRFAQTQSWDLTIARPGFIWGAQRMKLQGWADTLEGSVHVRSPYILPLCHVTNCANCLVSAVDRPTASIGQTFRRSTNRQ